MIIVNGSKPAQTKPILVLDEYYFTIQDVWFVPLLRNISMIVPSILWMIKALNQTSYSKEYFCIDYETVVYANVKFRLSCTMT